MYHIHSLRSISKIKFGTLGLVAIALLASLSVGAVFAPKAHAENWELISSEVAYGPSPPYTLMNSFGCKTLRNSPYGQVADVKIMFSKANNGSPFTNYVTVLRPNTPWPIQIQQVSSNQWWNGQTQIQIVTASILAGDYINGTSLGNNNPTFTNILFTNLNPLTLNNC